MTSAAALAHAALLSSDREVMARALEWATQGSFLLLEFLSPFISCCRALLDGAFGEAADHAAEFWDEAPAVPVWQVFALPLVNEALIRAGRVDVAGAVTERAAVLFADMATAPLLTTALQLSQGRVALARHHLDIAEQRAIAALDVATCHGLPLAAVDALELRAAVSEQRGATVVSRSLREGARIERERCGYRFLLMPTPHDGCPAPPGMTITAS
mgnify:CR=1 FL=1